MICSLLDKPKDLYVSNFMAFKSFIAKEILRYKNPYPYIDGLILRSTRKIAKVPMQDRERMSGTSTYTLRKLISLFSQWIYRVFHQAAPDCHIFRCHQLHRRICTGALRDYQ